MMTDTNKTATRIINQLEPNLKPDAPSFPLAPERPLNPAMTLNYEAGTYN